MSVAHNTNRCACCGQRICWGRQANVCIRERERRYHGVHSECPEAAARFMARHPRNALGIFYNHAPGCSAREKFACGCFALKNRQRRRARREATYVADRRASELREHILAGALLKTQDA